MKQSFRPRGKESTDVRYSFHVFVGACPTVISSIPENKALSLHALEIQL